jgi:S-adenosyl methyltransferase
MNAVDPENGTADPFFNPLVAHPARVYSMWLGGKDYYPADREAAEEVMRQRPEVVAGARANRAFLARAVRYLASERGIRQFLDIGPGLPAPGNAHQIAQAIDPKCRVMYVDNDPLVISHARALLTSGPRRSLRVRPGRPARSRADLARSQLDAGLNPSCRCAFSRGHAFHRRRR